MWNTFSAFIPIIVYSKIIEPSFESENFHAKKFRDFPKRSIILNHLFHFIKIVDEYLLFAFHVLFTFLLLKSCP